MATSTRGLSRADFLRLAAGALIALRAPARLLAADDVEAGAAEAIADYDRQGMHRTGTAVDDASAQWLAERARHAGASVTLEPFDFERVTVIAASVEADGRRVDALPLFDGTFTDAHGLTGALGTTATSEGIALVKLDATAISTEGRSIAELRRSSTVRAIVAVTDGAHAGLTPSNAVDFKTPYGVPVLQVSSEHGVWLDEIAHRGRDVRVVAHATRARASANNVIAKVAGSEPGLSPVVVMTPRSGWWNCAGERGGGLACWIEIARTAANHPGRRPVLLVASSGHELGHFGLDAFLERRPGLITTAAAWVHLGANIGAAGGSTRLQASADEIDAVASAALTRAGARVDRRVPRGTVPAGEARNIHVGGGRYVSLLGSSALFHSREDRWPAGVDVPAVAQFARAFAALTTALVSL